MSGCKRAWEVEAARDGRLSGNERLSIERHIASCADCTCERERLAALASMLRSLPVTDADELSLRRQRQELLARAHHEGSAQTKAKPAWRVGVAALVACAGIYMSWGRWSAQESQHGDGPMLALKASVGARYTQQASGERDIVRLMDGQLTLNVQRVGKRPGVLVRTPDGEVEDVGTIFTLIVAHGRTELISVAEGRVVARIFGQPERWVGAGETHRPYGTEELAAAGAEEDHAAEGPALARAVELPQAARRAVRGARAGQLPGAREPVAAEASAGAAQRGTAQRPPAESDAEAAAQFALAVARVEAHDDARAVVLLSQFVERFPGDARAQDAAFLGVVVLARQGNTSAMRRAAGAYLARYPRGFRAPEVARLLGENAAAVAP